MLALDWQVPYKPEKVNNKQLADDWRLFSAAIANIDAGKSEPFTHEDIIKWAVSCVKEIAKRVKKEDMKFTITEEKSEPYEKLWKAVLKELSKEEISAITTDSSDSDSQAICPVSPHAEITQGVQTFIKKVKFVDADTSVDADSDVDADVEKLAPVNPSGIELGEEITREDIMPYFKSFYRTKPYVSLIGGICTQGKTKGDIDFFINSDFRDTATEFRIIRMFPQEFWHRFRFTYPFQQETHPGKFTSHLDIYDEKIEVVSSPELVLMSVPKKVELFKFTFPLIKPAHGHYKGEEYSVDKLIEVVNAKPEWYDKGIYVQKKFDGVHLRTDHSKEGKVVIWSEEGNKLTKNLPSIEKELKEICMEHDIVLTGELESWEKGKHQPRQLTTSIIHTKEVHEKEPSVRLNIFDCLYYDEDIHNEPYSERLKFLAKIKDTEHIKKADYKLVHSPTELRKAVLTVSRLEGSEGAYLKRSDFFYELDGKTLLNLKYKNTYSLDCEVVAVHEVKSPS